MSFTPPASYRQANEDAAGVSSGRSNPLLTPTTTIEKSTDAITDDTPICGSLRT